MTEQGGIADVPSAYIRDKRTAPPSREELRARIPGWGADLDPADRPSYPRERFDPGADCCPVAFTLEMSRSATVIM